MRKIKILAISVISILLIAGIVGFASAKDECTTIQDVILKYSIEHYLTGELLTTGYDLFGYNYQAHMFNGYFANVYLGREGFLPYEGDAAAYLNQYPEAAKKWYWPYRDILLVIWWNDAWLSNKDCDGDGLLDRHYGFASYTGSGAWETNHQWGTDEFDGQICSWDYFVKTVAVPADADLVSGIWYTADGTEIGPSIWGEFAVIQRVYNSPCEGLVGIDYLSPASAGFGYYSP